MGHQVNALLQQCESQWVAQCKAIFWLGMAHLLGGGAGPQACWTHRPSCVDKEPCIGHSGSVKRGLLWDVDLCKSQGRLAPCSCPCTPSAPGDGLSQGTHSRDLAAPSSVSLAASSSSAPIKYSLSRYSLGHTPRLTLSG